MTSDGAWNCTLPTLSKRFLACTRVQDVISCIEDVPSGLLDDEFQENVLNLTVEHEVSKMFPPALSYRRAFLKALIAMIESRAAEVSENLYISYADLISSTEDENKEFGFVTYTMDDSSHITLKESKALVLSGTTGLTTWVGAKCLSEWCLANKHMLSGKRILELGCGVGLTGIAVCRRCWPASYTFTDCHEGVLDTVRGNVTINNLPEAVDVQVVPLDWGDFAGHNDWMPQLAADVVLGADLVYDVETVQPLVKTLKRLLVADAIAYVACTVRNIDTYNSFLAELDKSSLRRQFLPASSLDVFVYDRSVDVRLLAVVAAT